MYEMSAPHSPATSNPLLEEWPEKSADKSAGRPRSSVVWKYFRYDAFTGKSSCNDPACNYAQSGNITSNLRIHLHRKHPEFYAALLNEEYAIVAAKASTGKVEVSRKKVRGEQKQSTVPKWSNDIEQQSAAMRALAAALACTSTAINIVEHRLFERFCQKLNPHFEVPGRTETIFLTESLYSLMKEKTAAAIKAGGLLTLCTSIWTKKGMTESFLGITAHHLSVDWHHHVATLAARTFPKPHTAGRVRNLVENVMKEWEIEFGQVFLVITDNGSNMVASFKEAKMNVLEEAEEIASVAVTELDEDDDSKSLDEPMSECLTASNLFETAMKNTAEDLEQAIDSEVSSYDACENDHDETFRDIYRLPCFNHLLQLVVRKFDTVEENKELVQKAKKLVTKFNHSSKAIASLIRLSGKKLIGDVETRWNSTYYIIARLCDVRDDVDIICKDLKWSSLAMTDWKQLDQLKSFLQPFDVYTTLSSGQYYITTDLYVSIVSELKSHLEKNLKNKVTSAAAHVLLSEMSIRFAKFLDPAQFDHDAFYLAACFFHPFLHNLLTKEQMTSAVKYIKIVHSRYFAHGPSSAESDEAFAEASPKRPKFSNLSERLTAIKATMVARKRSSTIDGEINRYRNSSYPEYDEQRSAALFWRSEGQQFPKLALLATAFLGSVATSVSAEQIFLEPGMKTLGRGYRQAGHRLEAETLLSKNLSYFESSI